MWKQSPSLSESVVWKIQDEFSQVLAFQEEVRYRSGTLMYSSKSL